MKNFLEKISNVALSAIIIITLVATLYLGVTILDNNDKELQTYTRFNSCAIAQRSFKGLNMLTPADIKICWDRAEADTGFKVTRYFDK